MGNVGRFVWSPWSLVVLLLLILGWLGYSVKRIQTQLDQLQTSIGDADKITMAKTTEYGTLNLQTPTETRGVVYRNTIQVEGEADNNCVVMLLQNGKLIKALQPVAGRFSFADVELQRGRNILDVQMMATSGERLALAILDLNYTLPASNSLMMTLNRGDDAQPQIALTFDGGSLNNISGKILDYLRDARIPATFFLTGEFVQRFPETVRRIVAEGHEVGNHTMHHPHLTTFAENKRHDTRPKITRETLQAELSAMATAFEQVTGSKLVPLWRAPFGEQNLEIRAWAAEAGYRHVGWTVGQGNGENMDTMDWIANPGEPGYLSAAEIRDKILNFADHSAQKANGAIILMHLGSLRQSDFPHQQLPEIISALQHRQYQFIKVSEMLVPVIPVITNPSAQF